MTARLLGNRVLVQQIQPREVTENGVIRPASLADNKMQYKVLAVGQGSKRLKDGSWVPFGFSPGDQIITHSFEHDLFNEWGTNEKIISADNILAVIPKSV